ncbi:MAG: hypothetical protein ACRCSN_15760 [Dermatophilaceae bacterium]
MLVTAPLFVVLLLVTVFCVVGRSAEVGSVVLGVLLGLTLASTPVGEPILDGLTTAVSWLVDTVGSLAGQQ